MNKPGIRNDSPKPDWVLWRSFLAVAQQGSLSGAARSLGLTQPSVSRHIQLLEEQLNVALFTRSRQGLNPTAMAMSLLPHAQTMAGAAEQLQRMASAPQEQARGTVRVTASCMMGSMVLPQMLASFRRQQPEIALELVLSNRNEDLLQRQADIAVRMARPTQTALLARQVGQVRLGLYAHQSYVDEHGRPDTLADLSQHALIGMDRDNSALQHPELAALNLRLESFALRCDDDVAQLMAVGAGLGIGACQHALATGYPQLVPVLPELVSWSYEVWLVMHEDQRHTQRVRLLFDHLASALNGYCTAG